MAKIDDVFEGSEVIFLYKTNYDTSLGGFKGTDTLEEVQNLDPEISMVIYNTVSETNNGSAIYMEDLEFAP